MLDLVITEFLDYKGDNRLTFDNIHYSAGIVDIIFQANNSIIGTFRDSKSPYLTLSNNRHRFINQHFVINWEKDTKKATNIFIAYIPNNYKEIYNNIVMSNSHSRASYLESLLKTAFQDRPIIQQINNRSFYLKIDSFQIKEDYMAITIKHFIKNKIYKIPRDFTSFYFRVLEELQEFCEILDNVEYK